MNIVPTTASNTLAAIYDRRLIGPFHDRCEPFSTYPRITYDLLHVFHLFSNYKGREESCSVEGIMLEMDRIIRPQTRGIGGSNTRFRARDRDAADDDEM
ncbi:probable methyltransferase PMT7 [Asparagus officinalis]|uniref:probable methyltransferase PMT7 n=1 Tax=Asparagus officinalis TaxID=4686 RepID=UPI00098E0D60|nr:probable methyltransferase PMT7 [Asparagus officinalis]